MENVPKVIFKIQTLQIDKELQMNFDNLEKHYVIDDLKALTEIVNNKYQEQPLSNKPEEAGIYLDFSIESHKNGMY